MAWRVGRIGPWLRSARGLARWRILPSSAAGIVRTAASCRIGLALVAITAGSVAAISTITSAAATGDRALGEYLSGECVTCHQLSGAFKGIPPIVGWPEPTFVETMQAYRNRTRDHQIMRNIAIKFTEDEIAALAAYFGSLKPKN